MAHYFISYSSRDGAAHANRLSMALQARPELLPPWSSSANVGIGTWPQQIDRAIQECAALLLVLTADAAASEEVGAECARALRFKKPILPLYFASGVAPPLRLEERQHVDFTADFDAAMETMCGYLLSLQRPEARAAELEDRLRAAERDHASADTETSRRAGIEIRDVKAELNSLHGGGSARVQTPFDTVDGEDRARQRLRTINLAPSPPIPTFEDRVSESARIGEFLDDLSSRLLTVVGRAGVGKTAVVCRALYELERGRFPSDAAPQTPFEAIVYLGEGPSSARRISFAHFYDDLSGLLPDPARAAAQTEWQNSADTGARFNALARLLARRPVIVVLDNFEAMLDPANGEIADAEVAELLRLLLVGPDHGIKVIITTQEAPRELMLLQPQRQQYIALEEGLPSPYAERLLRAMDRDGVGLRDESDERLGEIREATRGFPRALEAFYGVLRADRHTSIDELLAAAGPPEHVVEQLVVEAFSRVDRHARAVIDALAVFNRPVLPDAVDFLVGADANSGAVEHVLRRLAAMYLVRHDRAGYYLHPADRRYALSQLEPGEPGDWADRREGQPQTLATLRFLAAQYLRASRPETVASSNDLEPALGEFELRSAAGDVDGAVEVLFEHVDVMLALGQRWPLLQMVSEVFDYTAGVERAGLEAASGFALASLGRDQPAVQHLRTAIGDAGELADPEDVAGWRLALADCLHTLREFDAASDELDRVLEVDGLDAGIRAAAIVALARIALTQARHGDADELQRRGLYVAVLAAPWAAADDDAGEERSREERLQALDLYNPTAWEVGEPVQFTAVDEDDEGEDAAEAARPIAGALCLIHGSDDETADAEILATELLAEIWLERASLAFALDELHAAEAACELAGALYESVDSFTVLEAMDLLARIRAELGPSDLWSDERLEDQERYLEEVRHRQIGPVEAWQLRSLGDAYLARDRVADAERAYRELEQLGQREFILDHVVTGRLGRARVSWVRDDIDTAVDLVEGLLAELPDDATRDRAEAFYLLGNLERSAYRNARAAENLTKARNLFAELGNERAVITTDQRLASVEIDTREYGQALRRLEVAAELARPLGVPSLTVDVLADLLAARLYSGDREGARALADEAVTLGREVQLPASRAIIEHAAGDMWVELEEYDAAMSAYDSARAIYRDLDRHSGEMGELLALAGVYGETEQFEDALAASSEALKIAADLADPSERRTARVAQAIALANLGRRDEAQSEIRQVLDEAQDPYVLGNAGWVYFLAGMYDESLDLSRKASEREPGQEWDRNIGHALLGMGRIDEARAQYRKVIEGRRGGEHFRRTIREVRQLLRRCPDLAGGQEVLTLLEDAQGQLRE